MALFLRDPHLSSPPFFRRLRVPFLSFRRERAGSFRRKDALPSYQFLRLPFSFPLRLDGLAPVSSLASEDRWLFSGSGRGRGLFCDLRAAQHLPFPLFEGIVLLGPSWSAISFLF